MSRLLRLQKLLDINNEYCEKNGLKIVDRSENNIDDDDDNIDYNKITFEGLKKKDNYDNYKKLDKFQVIVDRDNSAETIEPPTPFLPSIPFATYVLGVVKAGKCFCKGTEILMYDGSIKKVENIKTNELVMGDDSTPRKILGTTFGKEEMFEIIGSNNYFNFICNKSHILCLKYCIKPYIGYKNNKKTLFYFDNKNIKSRSFKIKENENEEELLEKYLKNHNPYINISVEKYLNLPKRTKQYLRMYQANNIDFKEKPLTIDPYIIGTWLGDGHSNCSRITNQDSTIIKYLKDKVKEYDCYLQYNSNYTYNIIGIEKCKNFIKKELLKYNLINNKHIPYEYKCNSIQNRLKLLAGLIDTDGYYDKRKNIYEIIQKNKKLSEDILYLCRSLGFRTNMIQCEKSCIYKGEKITGVYYRIYISGYDLNKIPVLCKRKKSVLYKGNYNKNSFSFKIESKGKGDYYGFELDGNHKFCLSNFIVSHNSTFVGSLIDCYIERFDEVIFVSPTSDLDPQALYLIDKYNIKRVYKSIKVIEKYMKEIKKKNKGKKPVDKINTLIIMDDVIAEIEKYASKKNNSFLTQLGLNRRHYGISIIMLSQYYKKCPPCLRTNFNSFVLFRQENYIEKKKIIEELSGFLGPKLFEEVFDNATKESYQALTINLSGDKKYQYTKNFNEFLLDDNLNPLYSNSIENVKEVQLDLQPKQDLLDINDEDIIEVEEEKNQEEVEEETKEYSKYDKDKLEKMNVFSLKKLCKENGIKKYSKMKKSELIDLLMEL